MNSKSATHIFISHATVAETYAQLIFKKLEVGGYKCWFAQRDVRLGEHYASELSRALTSSAAILLVLDDNANKSNHVLREITIATEKTLPIFVIQIGCFDLSEGLEYLLSGIQRILTHENDIDNSSQILIEQLSKSIPWVREKRSGQPVKAKIITEVPLDEWEYAGKLPFHKWLRSIFKDKS